MYLRPRKSIEQIISGSGRAISESTELLRELIPYAAKKFDRTRIQDIFPQYNPEKDLLENYYNLSDQQKSQLFSYLKGKNIIEALHFLNAADKITFYNPNPEELSPQEVNDFYNDKFETLSSDKQIEDLIYIANELPAETRIYASAGAGTIETDIKEPEKYKGPLQTLDDLMNKAADTLRNLLPDSLSVYVPYKIPTKKVLSFAIPAMFLSTAYIGMTQNANAEPEINENPNYQKPTRSSDRPTSVENITGLENFPSNLANEVIKWAEEHVVMGNVSFEKDPDWDFDIKTDFLDSDGNPIIYKEA